MYARTTAPHIPTIQPPLKRCPPRLENWLLKKDCYFCHLNKSIVD